MLFHWRYNATLLEADADVLHTLRHERYPDGSDPSPDDVGGWAGDAGTALRISMHVSRGRAPSRQARLEYLDAFVEAVEAVDDPRFSVRLLGSTVHCLYRSHRQWRMAGVCAGG